MVRRLPWPKVLGCPGDFIRNLLFFGFLFLYLQRQVDLRLIYHGGGLLANFPTFYWGSEFFRTFTGHPGGLLEYAGAGLAQTFFDPWLGPLALVALAWGTQASIAGYFRNNGAAWLAELSYAPALLMLALCARYVSHAHIWPAMLSMLSVWGLAYGYARFRPDCFYLRCLFLMAGTAAIFAFAGGAVTGFLLLCLLTELRRRESWGMFPVLVGLSLVPIVLGHFFYGLAWAELAEYVKPLGLKMWEGKDWVQAGITITYLALPALALLAIGFSALRQRSQKTPAPSAPISEAAQTSETAAPTPSRQPVPIDSGKVIAFSITGTLALLGLIWVVGKYALNPQLRAALRVDYFACQRQWPEVIREAKTAPSSVHVLASLDRALYHSGRLGDDLPLNQPADVLLLNQKKYLPDWGAIDIYLDLGFVNMAQHHLTEAIEHYGERPRLLQKLVLVNQALGNEGTARIYLNALAKVPFYSHWAQDCLRKLEQRSSSGVDEDVARLQQFCFTTDFPVPLPADALMVRLLERNKNNRMAFEYLLAHHLLNKNLAGFIKEWNRSKEFSLGGVPQLHQEALYLAAQVLGVKINVQSLPMGQTGAQRCADFLRQLKAAGSDTQKARESLRAEYAGSYYYFYYFE